MARTRQKVGYSRDQLDAARAQEHVFLASRRPAAEPVDTHVLDAGGRPIYRRKVFEQPWEAKPGALVRDGGGTADAFVNYELNLGIDPFVNNALASSTYGFNPITRNRILLEWMHRGNWLAGVAVNLIGDDMTQGGVDITSGIETGPAGKQSSIEQHLDAAFDQMGIWPSLNEAIGWGRLYGGAVALYMIDGQRMDTPLRLDTVARGQFKGLYVLDRWQLDPSLFDLVNEPGPNLGKPRFYTINDASPVLRGQRIHYSRLIRFEGIKLPHNQRMMENLWSISVLERLYDRIVAFDSATMGAAQLVYKSYIRTYKIKNYREKVALGGGLDELADQTYNYIRAMSRWQSIEGITVLDLEDEYVPHQQTSFTGISDALLQFGQQLAGALQIPLVRLFGMSPAGFSATGESDLRTHYDAVKRTQKRDLTVPIRKIYLLTARSEGIPVDEDTFGFTFRSLWQLDDTAKAQVAQITAGAVSLAVQDGILTKPAAARELRDSARTTGIFAAISDEDIEALEAEPPMGMLGMPGMGGEEGMLGGENELPGEEMRSPELRHEEAPRPHAPRLPHEQIGHRLRLLDASGTRDSFELVPGLPVYIETPKGTPRYPWSEPMTSHYGFVAGTMGMDGEEVDVFVGPEPDRSHDVFAVWQVNPETGAGDEWKLMIGFPSRTTALRAYQRSFSDGTGAARIGEVRRMPFDQLQGWLAAGNAKRAA